MENWILIAEYSKKYSISVSTVRRRIKNNEVEYKKDKGKYYVKDTLLGISSNDNYNLISKTLSELVETQRALLEEKSKKIIDLENKLRVKEEEIIELTMLINVLEEGEK